MSRLNNMELREPNVGNSRDGPVNKIIEHLFSRKTATASTQTYPTTATIGNNCSAPNGSTFSTPGINDAAINLAVTSSVGTNGNVANRSAASTSGNNGNASKLPATPVDASNTSTDVPAASTSGSESIAAHSAALRAYRETAAAALNDGQRIPAAAPRTLEDLNNYLTANALANRAAASAGTTASAANTPAPLSVRAFLPLSRCDSSVNVDGFRV